MKPIEQGGLELDVKDQALAIKTLSVAMVPVDSSITSEDAENDFSDLADRLVTLAREAEGSQIELNEREVAKLRNSVRVAELKLYYTFGFIACFATMNGLPEDIDIVDAILTQSELPGMQRAQLIANIGPAALELSSLLALHGPSPEM